MRKIMAFLMAAAVLMMASHASAGTISLSNGKTMSRLAGRAGTTAYFKFTVPAGANRLQVKTWGGYGNCDIYLRQGSLPTFSRYHFASTGSKNTETITVNPASAGDWYLLVHARANCSGVSLVASYWTEGVLTVSAPAIQPAGGVFTSSVNVALSCATTGAAILYTLDGSEPSPTSTVYAGVFTLKSSATVKARAYKTGMTASSTAAATFTVVSPPSGPALTTLGNGQIVSALYGSTGSQLYYKLAVPANSTQLVIGTWGGSGDGDLYVRRGAQPTLKAYDYRPYAAGNNEHVVLSQPASGDWYILLYGRSSFSGMNLQAFYRTAGSATVAATPVITPAGGAFSGSVTFSLSCATAGATIRYTLDGTEPTASSAAYAGPYALKGSATVKAKAFKSGLVNSATAVAVFTVNPSALTTLGNGQIVSALYGSTGSQLYYKLAVPANSTQLVIGTWGGSGDGDLYVRRGAQPTLKAYDYRPYAAGNNEHVVLSQPASGDWYILLYGRSSFSGMNLQAFYRTAGSATVAATPVITPAGGAFSGSVTFSLSCATAGATIRYTLDGTEPTASSAAYAGPYALKGSATVKAKAFKSGLVNSATAVAVFTLNPASVSGVDLDRFSWKPTSANGTTGNLTLPLRWETRRIGMSADYTSDYLGRLNPNSSGNYVVTIPARTKLIIQMHSTICPDPSLPSHGMVLEFSFDPRYAQTLRTTQVTHYNYGSIYSTLRNWTWQLRSSSGGWNKYRLVQ
ncbi:MAG TPA: chitobiase/beta-hexosaminidase C-terminal domain-containing protein [Kiritimatiellia bacterium]|nr:chitobiase/beta-hexosaminidase C-terminal domain-containing protein [Kiritimatiellia bacterium]